MRRLSGVLVTVLLVACSLAIAAEIEPVVIDSPPPELLTGGPASATVESGAELWTLGASQSLTGVPAAMWHYGCSATSAGMLFGYYDNHGYDNMFAGTISGNIDTPDELSLIATPDHVSDYWTGYQDAGPDPWEGNWAEHTWNTCTADFMGTNQWKWDLEPPSGTRDTNTDGSTTFWFTGNGSPVYDYQPDPSYGTPVTAGTHGLRLFAESRGYTVAYENGHYMNYTQRLDTVYTGGFSYEQYKAQIDAGRPVLLHATGHTMLGFGYNDDQDPLVLLYNTWQYTPDVMTWGGTYSWNNYTGTHYAVTVVELDPAPMGDVPEPGTLGLFGLGVLAAGLWVRRRRAA